MIGSGVGGRFLRTERIYGQFPLVHSLFGVYIKPCESGHAPLYYYLRVDTLKELFRSTFTDDDKVPPVYKHVQKCLTHDQTVISKLLM